jgi:6-phosphogluconolactonase
VQTVRADSAEEAALRAAALVERAAAEAIGERGRFNFAVSGGSSPWRMFELLSDGPMDWSRTSMFQVDERIAPTGSPDRNLTHLVLSLPLACQSAIRPMPVGADDLEAAAGEYEYSLPDRLDLVHLGLGPDGHTASLVPGDSVLDVADRSVALTGGEYQGRRRMTLTYPALDRARAIFFLVLGDDKRNALARLLEHDSTIPAGKVEGEDVVVITDVNDPGEADR